MMLLIIGAVWLFLVCLILWPEKKPQECQVIDMARAMSRSKMNYQINSDVKFDDRGW